MLVPVAGSGLGGLAVGPHVLSVAALIDVSQGLLPVLGDRPVGARHHAENPVSLAGGIVVGHHENEHGEVLENDLDEEDDIEALHINSTRIYIFDVDSGNFVRSYVTGHDTGLSLPTAFDFMPGDGIDCNLNLIQDSCDIASGFSLDDNRNGIPDECDLPCPWDIDGNGVVDVTDFLALLNAWGPNPGHPADFDGNDVVDAVDFLALLDNWGDCP